MQQPIRKAPRNKEIADGGQAMVAGISNPAASLVIAVAADRSIWGIWQPAGQFGLGPR
jgi:hypothetical protein